MVEKRAVTDKLDITVTIGEEAEVTPELRAALVELAEALYEETLAEQEVQAFRLGIGDMGLDPAGSGDSFISCGWLWDECWGYDGGHCRWFSRKDKPIPGSCDIYAIKK